MDRVSVRSIVVFLTLLCLTPASARELPPISGPSSEGIYEATLDNGLKVLMKEVHTAPLMCVSIWYRGGSKHEEAGKSGIAHILEHMMFKGTERYGKGVFDRTLEANGAENNATTWMDRTNYYITISADKTDLALELEADRMRNALFTQEDLDDEMPVVRNEMELGQDDPWVELEERMVSLAYLEHPYHHPVIGWKDDVEASTAQDVRDYYDRHYWPDNAYMVLVGDLEAEEMLRKVVHHFGEIPRGANPKPIVTAEPAQKGERRILIRESGQNRLLGIGYRTPASLDPDTPALEMLGHVLATGRTSRLYRTLVEKGLATDVEAYAQPLEDPYLFFVYVWLAPEADPDVVESLVYRELDRVMEEPPSRDELDRALKQVKVEELFNRDDLVELTFLIGEAEAIGGYHRYETHLADLASVLPEDLSRVASEYFVADSRTVGFYLPNGEPGGSWYGEPSGELAPAAADRRADGPRERRRNGLRFRRGGASGSNLPSGSGHDTAGGSRGEGPVLHELSNGATLLVQESRENPTLAIRARLEGGLLTEPETKHGVAALVAESLPLGTQTHSSGELAQLMESHGISIQFRATAESIEMTARSLSEDYPLLVELIAEILAEPAFSTEQLEISRSRVLSALRDRTESTYRLAYTRALEEVYGKGSPYARFVEGTEASLQALSQQDLFDYHRGMVQADRWTFAVVGDVDADQTREMFDRHFSTFDRGKLVEVDRPVARPIETGFEVVRIPVQDKSQVDIIAVGPGVPPESPEFDAAYLANVILGGSFTSRLMSTLRDDEGLTYGAYSDFVSLEGDTYWMATLGVNPENLEKAIASLKSVLGTAHSPGITDEEVSKAREYAAGSFPIRLNSKSRIARTLLEGHRLGFGLEYIPSFGERMRAVRPDDVREAAGRFADPDRIVLVVAGTFQ